MAGAIAALALGGRWLTDQGASSGSRANGQGRSQVAGSQAARGERASFGADVRRTPDVIVHVAGLVRRPGIYRFRQGARVYEAIAAAGGPAAGADQNAIDLAARLSDGSRLFIGSRGAGQGQAGVEASSAGDGGAAGPVSLNDASVEQLDQLDGIGPALAARIVEWRRDHGSFSSVADLDRVPGIGPAKLAALRSSLVP